MKKSLLVFFALLSLMLVGCGTKESKEEVKVEKEKSEDVFANGDSFKMRKGDNLSYFFELTSTEPNILTVYDLENNRREYRFAYTAEKQDNGHLLYTFDGEKINGKSVFTTTMGIESHYYIVKSDDSYIFVYPNQNVEELLNSGSSMEEIKIKKPKMFERDIMDKF